MKIRNGSFSIPALISRSVSKPLILLMFITGGGLTCAKAQSHRYNGPSINLKRIRQEPSACEECNRLALKSGREVLACNFGVEEGRRMAVKYGGGHGYRNGFLRGFSWGLHSMAAAAATDEAAISQGALAADGLEGAVNSGLQLGRQQGKAQGSIAGANLAVSRFISAVDTGKFPSAQFTVPEVTYPGEDNGYEQFVDSNGARSPGQILRKELRFMNSHMRAYDHLDRIFQDDVRRLSIWDLWYDDGVYRFKTRPWLDAEAALEIWFKKPMKARSRFLSLNKPPLTETVLDSRGKPVVENGKPKVRFVDLRQVFKSAFVSAYKHYVHYYFSSEFYRALDEGEAHGELVGIELGKRMAYQKGMIDAFNAKFKQRSKDAFQSAYERAFRSSFQTTFDDYADNPRLDISFNNVIGLVDDGIIQPGETVAVSFTVRNSGGRGTRVRASLIGDVVERRLLVLGEMPALATRVFRTPAIGVIDPQLHTGLNADLILKVNDKETPHAERVMTPIQIASHKSVVDTLTGSARTYIAVNNISTLPSTGEIKVDLILPGKTAAQPLGILDAGRIKEAELSFSGLDPLELIKGLDAKIQVTMNGRFMSDGSLKLVSPDYKRELAVYFDQLIKGEGLIPAASRLEGRITEVRRMIADKNLAEVSGDMEGNPWKDDGLSTMLGLLVHSLKSVDQTSATRKRYGRLGRALWEHRKKLGKFLFFKSGKRKAYESLCKELMQNN